MLNGIKIYTVDNFTNHKFAKKLTTQQIKDIKVVGNVLPFKSNNYVVEKLINWDNIPEDPMFTLTFPRKEMLTEEDYYLIEKLIDKNASHNEINQVANQIRTRLNPHPANQIHNIPEYKGQKLYGVQHKYRETVLFFPSHGQTCHAYCTFCFRWPQFVSFKSLKFATKEINLLVNYLKSHKEVTDVLFTGGDPMIMSAELLKHYIEPLLSNELKHIQTIRIGTKSLSYWPYRYFADVDSQEILNLFNKIVDEGKNLAIMAHFNHYKELQTDEVKLAIRNIRQTRAQIRTQSPILNHINNDPNVWIKMWREQVNNNCIPYYMFLPRDTGAKHFFDVSLKDAWDVFRNAYKSVSGVCRTVRGPSMSATPGKIQIIGISEIKGEKVFVLRFLQGRNPDWVDIPFFAKYDEKASWLSELTPAFDEEKFFFEDEMIQRFNEKFTNNESDRFE
ncbi:MAG: lysine 2,3-aminomutase [Candidatus Cloacimonetes bacterium]|nr:lysine 2,3-aminomutase [Candidatus Cloacimonadota bacterium]